LDHQRVPVNDTERRARIADKPPSDLFPYFGANGQVGWIDGYLFDEPLILLAEDGGAFGSPDRPIAYAASGRFWVNNHAHVLRPRSNLDFDYLLHAIRVRPDVGELVAGSTRAKLNQETAASIPVPLPPLDEQRRIAGLLNHGMARIGQALAATEARLSATRALRHAVLRSAFSAGSVQRWPAVSLESAAAIVSGVTLGRPLPVGPLRTVPYLTVANVKDGYLELEGVKSIEVTHAEFEKWRLAPGDLLLTEGGDPDKLGRGTIWRGEIADCIHQNHIFRVRFPPQEMLPEFAAAQVSSPYGKAYFAAHAKQTTGIATINQRVLRAFPLLRPPLSEQERIVAELRLQSREIERLERHAKEQSTAINALPAALLQQAFGGAS
jgi:type I restriction enzyme S subunit